MSRLAVWSDAPAGGDRVWLDSLADVRGLRFSKGINGDREASWQANIPAGTRHRALNASRQIGIVCGTSTIWTGTLDKPERGDAWSFTAIGRASDANRYIAVAATTGNSLNLNEVVDAAIARGLNWTRTASLPSLPAGAQNSGTLTLNEALTTVTSQSGSYWTVDRYGAITTGALPTTVTQTLMATTAPPRILHGLVTDVWTTYIDQDTALYTVRLDSNTAARNKYGRFEATLDITSLGAITATQAATSAQAYLNDHAPRPAFTQPFTAVQGQLLNANGAPIDLALATALQVTRVILTDPDSATESSTGPVTIIIGEVEYDVDADVLTLTPYESAGNGLLDVLSNGASAAANPLQAYGLLGVNRAMATGTVNVVVTAATNGTATITYPAGLFTSSPYIVATVVSAQGAAIGSTVLITANSSSSATVRLNLTGTVTATIAVHWVAVQTV